jgi:hypothetical protein
MYMKKDSMLKKIAQKGYDVSYAANLNFATYDIVSKFPSVVSFLSIAIGILGLVVSAFQLTWVSVSILIIGIMSLYVEHFTVNKEEYGERGRKNTALMYRLKNLYYKVKDLQSEEDDFTEEEKEYEAIEKEFNDTACAKQILFANWFAHYKLFMEKDCGWLDEQLHFGFWKDKIPGTAKVFLLILVLVLIVLLIIKMGII